ncbi:flagellar protein FlaG [Shewanella submarina]|uniref:Flagellar protein FlaG n=1 Tax=Shewanella submarina TaxID=2016376 RepID=A0ABV7GMU0_9GAMM|nr:flagellar protein FlaG [Shewanella submarina]MCL1036489.1 flagellar protein FlaG [Shewanella submarina]
MDIQTATTSTLAKQDASGIQVKQSHQMQPELDPRGTINAVEESAKKENAKEQPTEKQLEDLATNMSDMMSMMRKGLAFRVDDSSGTSVVSVLDVESGEVLRQIPSEEALELAAKLTEVTGLLMKTEA